MITDGSPLWCHKNILLEATVKLLIKLWKPENWNAGWAEFRWFMCCQNLMYGEWTSASRGVYVLFYFKDVCQMRNMKRKKNPPRKPDAPLNSQLICANRISMFSFCMATFPSNPWADSFSVANDLFSLAVIHHRIRWLLNQSSIRKSSTFSLLLSQRRWCSSQDVQIYVSDACIAWFPVLSISPAPVLHHPHPTATMIKQSFCILSAGVSAGHKLEDGSRFVEIRTSSALRSCDRSRHPAKAPLVGMLY